MKVDLKTVEAIIGAHIKSCDTKMEIFPFDHYTRGSKDALVNVLKAVRRDAYMKDAAPSEHDPIDKTRA